MSRVLLGVNIDHIATVRNARGGVWPCPVEAALIAKDNGADGITAHLREDRRHIKDADMRRLALSIGTRLNFEMAVTDEMASIACEIGPAHSCLVPEKREELTTEGGLDVLGQFQRVASATQRLTQAGIDVSLFIDPDPAQLKAAADAGAPTVELHTGAYCDAHAEGDIATRDKELAALRDMSAYAHDLGLEVHAGHGLTYDTVQPVAAFPEVMELNIGHFLIGESIFLGMEPAILEMRRLMDEARKPQET